MIIEQGFDKRLTIVKIALNRNRKSTISNHRCHLPLLHWRDTAIREQNKHINRITPLKRLKRGRACISACRP